MSRRLSSLFRRLSALPPWTLTAVCTAAILWLTLAPRPLGDLDAPLFEGADKVVHAIMFGGLVFTLLLDWTRRHSWRKVSSIRAIVSAVASSALGIAIEYAQHYMGLGRGFDILDIAADITGAVASALLWLAIGHRRSH